ncbi:MAG: hypothetical protein ACP5JP_09085 [bacterium]
MHKKIIFVWCLSLIFLCASPDVKARELSMRKAILSTEITQNKNTYFKAGIGAMLVPFSSYRPGFSFGIEGGERVYRYKNSSLSVGLGIDYYPVSKSGSTTSNQTGNLDYSMSGYALPILLKGTYTYTINDWIDAYAGIGLGMIVSGVSTAISGFSSVGEQNSTFAFSIYPGIKINKLGPGALFAEFNFLSSSVSYLTTGSANIGGMLFLIGYNIYF